MTIINGISRIGYMSGGKSARWIDEDIADVITDKAVRFIQKNKNKPFFLYFSTHDIHVPRVPASRFTGKSGLGPRGDVILEFDWSVGQIMNALDSMRLSDNTIIIVTSDNGPVLDDGYRDQAVELLKGHTPSGPLRGGKYSLLEGGTRVVFIISWKGKVIPGVTKALFSQIDLLSSLASLTGQALAPDEAPDSFDQIGALLGKTGKGREWVVEHSGGLSIIKGDWKLIEPSSGPKIQVNTNTETGNSIFPQLYNMNSDIGEKFNVAKHNPDLVNEMSELLRKIRTDGRTRF
jgi:arylsulfatase A-like enzyme